MHPRAGLFGYRHWLGVLAEKPGNEGLRERAHVLKLWDERRRVMRGDAAIQVAGWAMDNMKPRDFTHSVQPIVALEPEANDMLIGLVEAAEQAALALRAALEPVLSGGEAREGEREAFYTATEADFRACFSDLKAEVAPVKVAADWLKALKSHALAQFDALALPGLDQRESDTIERIVQARGRLVGSFVGYGTYGDKMFGALLMEKPVVKKKGTAA